MKAKQTIFRNLLALTVTASFFFTGVNAQVTIGNSEEPTPGAVLDLSKVESKDLGLMLPQVSLTTLSSWEPLSGTASNGMFVYNTNESLGVGIYYWKDDSWVMLGTATSGGDSWSMTGNAGTDKETSFIGTTDDKPLAFRVKNEPAGYIGNFILPGARADSIANVSYGWMALQNPYNGHSNTAIGTYALNWANRQPWLELGNIANFNTAIGARALEWNAVGSGNIAIGAYAMQYGIGSGNVSIGQNALQNNSGDSNVAIGTFAMSTHMNDSRENIAIGRSALQNNLASQNTAVGHEAANNNTIGEMLVAVGRFALRSNTSGSQNTALGYNALNDNKTGHLNTAIGSQAMPSNVKGDYNAALGAKSLFLNTEGSYNTAIGVQTMNENTTGSSNTGVGSGALYSNIDAIWNTGVGTSASWFNESGQENTAVGGEALAGNQDGSWNTAVGTRALWSVELIPETGNHIVVDEEGNVNAHALGESTASENTAVGYEALKIVTKGGGNTALGMMSMVENTEGGHNVAVGRTALTHNTVGGGNVAIGSASMGSNMTGDYNTAIGHGANIGFEYNFDEAERGEPLTNSTAIGASAHAWKSNQVMVGSVEVTSVGGVVNWTRTSDMESMEVDKQNIGPVPGLSFINRLNPITYNFPEASWIKGPFRSIMFSGFNTSEVAAAAAEVEYDFSGVDEGVGLRYADFVVPLVQAVKELSAENTSLKLKIDQLTIGSSAEKELLESKIDGLSDEIEALKELVNQLIEGATEKEGEE